MVATYFPQNSASKFIIALWGGRKILSELFSISLFEGGYNIISIKLCFLASCTVSGSKAFFVAELSVQCVLV